jgi:transcriptional regulator with XRE-family HTH domain
MIFAELLRVEMARAGLSQKELADAAGLTQASVSRYLADLREPKWRDVQKLADALGVPVTAFLEDDTPAGSGSLSHPEPEPAKKAKPKGGAKKSKKS